MSIYTKEELGSMNHFLNKNCKTKTAATCFKELFIQNKTHINLTKDTIKSNYSYLNQLMIQFFINQKSIGKNAQQTFWHEWGHMYEATRLGYEFTIIILKDYKIHHLFYLNKKTNTINYTFINASFCDSLKALQTNGVAYFRKEKPDLDDLKKIAFGGFKQDFYQKIKSNRKIYKSMGCPSLFRKVNNTSDLSFILKNKNSEELEKLWKNIYDFFYSKEGEINISEIKSPFPIDKYREKINSL